MSAGLTGEGCNLAKCYQISRWQARWTRSDGLLKASRRQMRCGRISTERELAAGRGGAKGGPPSAGGLRGDAHGGEGVLGEQGGLGAETVDAPRQRHGLRRSGESGVEPAVAGKGAKRKQEHVALLAGGGREGEGDRLAAAPRGTEREVEVGLGSRLEDDEDAGGVGLFVPGLGLGVTQLDLIRQPALTPCT